MTDDMSITYQETFEDFDAPMSVGPLLTSMSLCSRFSSRELGILRVIQSHDVTVLVAVDGNLEKTHKSILRDSGENQLLRG